MAASTCPDRPSQKARLLRVARGVAGERGHEYVEARLVALGARRRTGSTSGGAWLATALDDIGAVRIRHAGVFATRTA